MTSTKPSSLFIWILEVFFTDFQFARKLLGGEWIHVFRFDPGPMGSQGYRIWLRPEDVQLDDQLLDSENWGTAWTGV